MWPIEKNYSNFENSLDFFIQDYIGLVDSGISHIKAKELMNILVEVSSKQEITKQEEKILLENKMLEEKKFLKASYNINMGKVIIF